ncbi:TonB-dependent receptor plug domain-containing protein [Leptolyngbya sp. 7M]|uniref:TonB-dependent receptor plug domain-containing protein n=1 Tax=Leptolyngbya sp. 7M TaxID=2812896 RepID=UPI001B8BB77B|nr:TonB-dependent receptor plug domain-containing protein [Leptolyngbya sp. 7M]QYO63277.1 TonB-dependent receptor plug domain-containing protein [Leptolyngbya sp. 7M]
MKRWQWLGWAVVVSIVGGAGTSATAIAGEVSTSPQPSPWQGEGVETGEGAASGFPPYLTPQAHPRRGLGGTVERSASRRVGGERPQLSTNIPQLTDLDQSVTTVEEWVAQIEASNGSATPEAIVQITGVRVEATEAGLQVILETADGVLAVPETRSVGNALIADITNATIAEEFSQATPIEGIALVSVTSLPGDRVRVAITGTDAPPVAEITSAAEGLAFAVMTGTATAAEEEELQVVVTGEQEEGYYVPNTSLGTRTDTPLRDIPQSIQIVPRQVLEDRQVRTIIEGLENVSGVYSASNFAGGRDYFTIRGFDAFNVLVNGLPDPQITNDGGFLNVERLEVLRGPASVLYGDSGLSSIGGTVNYVTRQPLSEPFYEVSATIGSYNDYQGTIDLSGPLNDSRTALYRFIAGYRSSETFIDFNDNRELSIAPSLSLSLDQNTDLVIEGDVSIQERNGQQPEPIPAVGTVLSNPNGEIRRSFNAVGPVEDKVINGRVGYRFEHRFNENLRLRNAFRYTFRSCFLNPINRIIQTNGIPSGTTISAFCRTEFISRCQ